MKEIDFDEIEKELKAISKPFEELQARLRAIDKKIMQMAVGVELC